MKPPTHQAGHLAGARYSLATLFVFVFAAAYLAMAARAGLLVVFTSDDPGHRGLGVGLCFLGGIFGIVAGWRWSRNVRGTITGWVCGAVLGLFVATQLVAPPPLLVSLAGAAILVTLAWLVSPTQLDDDGAPEDGPVPR